MVKNRNKLIDLFIGNLSNAIVHDILEKAIDLEEIKTKYSKEIKTSFDIAKYYRNKINPANTPLPAKDISEIRKRITNNVKNELKIRILKGYKNIDLGLIEENIKKFLKEMRISE